MNDDDLAARLANWRPADPPPDLLRRLRASEPTARVKGFWFWREGLPRERLQARALAYAGLLTAAAVLTLVLGQLSQAPVVQPAGRPYPAPTAREGGATLDLTSFGQPGLKYAVLEAGPSRRSANVFRLDAPTGPVRLDCGYTMLGNNNSSLGRFDLNLGDPF